MRVFYFAYGSNMRRARLEERVAAVRSRGRARLDGHRLRMNKRGADGSAKANIQRAPGHQVWGVLYELAAQALGALDRFEVGYARVQLAVEFERRRVLAATYIARPSRLCDGLAPRPRYKAHMVDGAREHALPERYVSLLEGLPVAEGLPVRPVPPT